MGKDTFPSMSENKINFLHRNYDEYRQDLLDITRKYYPDVFQNINDASVGQWMIDLLADMGDNLQYHIDRVFQETDIDSAQQLSSLQNIARTNGFKIPGKKAALCEIEISCELPLFTQGSTGNGNISVADESYAPLFKRGTLFSTGMVTFELTYDVDFKEQFDSNGVSNRKITPTRDTNGNIISYTYTKLAVVTAGQTKMFKQAVSSSDVKPFMEILLQDSDILGVESIIMKQGTGMSTDPLVSEFTVDEETYYDKTEKPVMRFFEVENLLDQYRYGYEVEQNTDGTPIGDNDTSTSDSPRYNYYNPIWEVVESVEIDGETIPLRRVAKGAWKRLKNKFITEYDDDWNLKITFGAGIRNVYGTIPTDAAEFTKYMMTRMEANDYMGVLPEAGCTLYILYRVGGGEQSNIAADSLTSIIYSNIVIEGNCDDGDNSSKIRDVRNSLKVTNTTPSYGGKDEPNADEIRYMIKYNSGALNRCVTVNDYYAMINKIPAKYGCPFRIGVIEENNKVAVYALGLDYNGYLVSALAEQVADNIKEYLKMYKSVNDYVEIKSGKIINLAFTLTVYVDKTYDKSEVTKRIIDTTYDYMDIRRHQMGEDIFLGDLQKEISKLDGVINLVSLRCYNKVGDGYSNDEITQALVNEADCCYSTELEGRADNLDNEINLIDSDYILFSEANSMFEIKYKNKDIIVVVKTR